MALHVVTCGELLWKPIDVYNLKSLRSTSEVNQTWLEDGAFGVIPKRQIERGIEGRCDCIFATVGFEAMHMFNCMGIRQIDGSRQLEIELKDVLSSPKRLTQLLTGSLVLANIIHI